MGTLKLYLMNVLIGFDQLANAFLAGDPDETISSRLGKAKKRDGGTLKTWTWYGIARPLDAFLSWLDPNHSIDAIEADEGGAGVDRD